VKILIITTEWPLFPDDVTGIHVVNQVRELRNSGIEVDVFSFRGKKNLVRYLRSIFDLRQLDLHSFDLIHAHHGQAGIVALSQNVLPVVVTFHGSDLQGIRDKLGNVTLLGKALKWISSLVARYADEVILVSDHLKKFIPARSYCVIPAGIDINLFQPLSKHDAREKLGLSQSFRYVLFVGDPARTEKRFSLAHDVVELLKDKMNVELLVAKGIPHRLIPLYMNACDVLLITSFSEGSPTIVKEALACHLPIVSVDVGDIRASIGNFKGCIISDSDEVSALASSVASIVKHPQNLHIDDNLSGFDESTLIQKVILVYEKIVSSR
jgi:glycosyltransferase involved in cell wall biosynthesis